MRRHLGFSLIELMVVVAIMGILLALGFPSFKTWLNTTEIRNAAETVQNGMQLARVEAMRRNERVSYWLVSLSDPKVMDNSCARSGSGTSWVVSRDDPSGSCSSPPSDTNAPRLIQTKAAGDGNRDVAVSATDSGGAATSCITFNGFGQVQATCTGAAAANPIARVAVSLSATDPNARLLEIHVSPGGVIRMCDPAVNSLSDPRHC